VDTDALRAGRWKAFGLIAVLSAARGVIAATSPLGNVEAYDLAWARFPSLGYSDHAPLLAWLAWLTEQVSGSTFALRAVGVACAAIFGILIYRLGERLFSPRAGLLALAIVSGLPAFFAASVTLSPDGLLAPLWAAALLTLWKMRDENGAWRPILLGALTGLAFLAQFSGVLLVPVIVAWLALTPVTRRWWNRPSLYLGSLTALAIASPVLIWNQQHGWPILQLRHATAHPTLASAGQWALTQWMAYHPLLMPALLLAMAWAVLGSRYDARCRLMAWASAPVLVALCAAMLRTHDAPATWTMIGWAAPALTAAAWVDQQLLAGSLRAPVRWHGRAAALFSVAMVALDCAHAQAPSVPPLMPKPDVTLEQQTWSQVREAIRAEAPALGGDVVVASGSDALCAQLLQQLDDTPNVYCPGGRRTAFEPIGRREPPTYAHVLYVDDERASVDPVVLMPLRQCLPLRTLSVERGAHPDRRFRLFGCSPVQPLNAQR